MFTKPRWMPVALTAVVMIASVFAAGCGSGERLLGRDTSTIAPSVSGGSMGSPGMPPTEAGKGSSDAAAPIADTESPQASADILGRKIIRTGTLGLEVQSVAEAYDRTSAVATRAGGYVQEGSFFGAADERSASLVLRVPAERYDAVVAELRGLAKEVRTSSMQTRDATAEVADMEATIRNLRAVEAQYVTLLGRANAINDVLLVQDRLRQVRLEIDRTEARLALTTKLSDLATITVQLAPVPAVPQRIVRNPLDAAVVAWEASVETLRVIATGVVMVLVFSWWLIPLVGLGVYVARRMARARRAIAPTEA